MSTHVQEWSSLVVDAQRGVLVPSWGSLFFNSVTMLIGTGGGGELGLRPTVLTKRNAENTNTSDESAPAPQSTTRQRGHRRTFEIKATPQAAYDWDFNSARPPGKRTNIIESIGHLIKSCLGGGLLAIHEAYKQCGLATSFFLTIILGFLVSYCMFMLAKSAQKIYGRVQIPAMSYPDLAETALAIGPFQRLRKFSRCFRYAVDFTICVDLFGSCCVYQVMICRTIKQLVEGTDEISNEGNPPLRVYILAIMIPCLLICMITTLKYLAPFSIAADIFIVIITIATVYYASKSATMSPLDFPAFKNLGGFLEFLGVCVFSMEGIGVTLAIENNMQEPKKIGLVLAAGMSIVVTIVLVMGSFGYWGFGESARSPVTVNFPLSPFPIALKVFMALMVYVTFALNFWVPFDLVWYYIKKRYDPSKYWLWERVYRAIFVIIITLTAFTFPNVSTFIGLLGSFCLSNMGFIYPAFIELCLDWEYPGLGFMKWRLIKFILIALFGLFLCCFGTYSNAKELIRQSF
ncbi:unnamed protein product [Parnassius mnemosyne]|uniref:Amino acid transporter transmembrane domain-containing protein n=1 Tax=Parnassius mnemosyne TaxID=213953 RepID=A0AAV1LHG1_9NEOP